MVNSTDNIYLNINLGGDSGGPSDILIPLVVPIFVTSIVGSIAWVVQKYVDSRDARKKVYLEDYGKKLDIIWKLQLYLQRHKSMLQKYTAIREGRFSVDSSPDQKESDHSTSGDIVINVRSAGADAVTRTRASSGGASAAAVAVVDDNVHDLDHEAGVGAVGPTIVYASDKNLVNQMVAIPETQAPSAAATTSTELNERDQLNITIIGDALNHYANHIKVGKIYDSRVVANLICMRSLITDNIETIAPDEIFSKLLQQLDKYTNLYESLREVGDATMPDRSQGAEFPDNIYEVVRIRLEMLTQNYTALLN